MRVYIKSVAFIAGAVAVWIVPIVARAQGVSDIPDKLMSQCGIASALLVAAVIYLAASNAKTRSAWEEDRKLMASSYEKLAVSNAKLEGMVLGVQRHGGGGC